MITVLMGAPGAGKSTWITNNYNNEYIYKTDGVRINRTIDIGAYMNNQRLKAVKAAESGQSIIADGTHTITKHRLLWLNLAKRLEMPTRLIVFTTPLSTLISVQLTRAFPAPRNVVISHFKRLELAKQLIDGEGWNEIIYINR